MEEFALYTIHDMIDDKPTKFVKYFVHIYIKIIKRKVPVHFVYYIKYFGENKY